MAEYGDEGDAYDYDIDSDDSEAREDLENALYSQIYHQANEEADDKLDSNEKDDQDPYDIRVMPPTENKVGNTTKLRPSSSKEASQKRTSVASKSREVKTEKISVEFTKYDLESSTDTNSDNLDDGTDDTIVANCDNLSRKYSSSVRNPTRKTISSGKPSDGKDVIDLTSPKSTKKSRKDIIQIDNVVTISSSNDEDTMVSKKERVVISSDNNENPKDAKRRKVSRHKIRQDSESDILSDIDTDLFPVHISTNVRGQSNEKQVGLQHVLNSLKDGDWSVKRKDEFPVLMSKRYYGAFTGKCTNCNERGHLSKICPKPKKAVVCIWCGQRGHNTTACDRRQCDNCKLTGHGALGCPHSSRKQTKCATCFISGHPAEECPNKWRQFHLTTSLDNLKESKKDPTNKYSNCSNCGRRGHFNYECGENRMGYCARPIYPFIPYYELENEKHLLEMAGGKDYAPPPPSTPVMLDPPHMYRKRKHDQSEYGGKESAPPPPSSPVMLEPQHVYRKRKHDQRENGGKDSAPPPPSTPVMLEPQLVYRKRKHDQSEYGGKESAPPRPSIPVMLEPSSTPVMLEPQHVYRKRKHDQSGKDSAPPPPSTPVMLEPQHVYRKRKHDQSEYALCLNDQMSKYLLEVADGKDYAPPPPSTPVMLEPQHVNWERKHNQNKNGGKDSAPPPSSTPVILELSSTPVMLELQQVYQKRKHDQSEYGGKQSVPPRPSAPVMLEPQLVYQKRKHDQSEYDGKDYAPPPSSTPAMLEPPHVYRKQKHNQSEYELAGGKNSAPPPPITPVMLEPQHVYRKRKHDQSEYGGKGYTPPPRSTPVMLEPPHVYRKRKHDQSKNGGKVYASPPPSTPVMLEPPPVMLEPSHVHRKRKHDQSNYGPTTQPYYSRPGPSGFRPRPTRTMMPGNGNPGRPFMARMAMNTMQPRMTEMGYTNNQQSFPRNNNESKKARMGNFSQGEQQESKRKKKRKKKKIDGWSNLGGPPAPSYEDNVNSQRQQKKHDKEIKQRLKAEKKRERARNPRSGTGRYKTRGGKQPKAFPANSVAF